MVGLDCYWYDFKWVSPNTTPLFGAPSSSFCKLIVHYKIWTLEEIFNKKIYNVPVQIISGKQALMSCKVSRIHLRDKIFHGYSVRYYHARILCNRRRFDGFSSVVHRYIKLEKVDHLRRISVISSTYGRCRRKLHVCVGLMFRTRFNLLEFSVLART
jgi:hypothetical protein